MFFPVIYLPQTDCGIGILSVSPYNKTQVSKVFKNRIEKEMPYRRKAVIISLAFEFTQ
jgi:hypothetical protein